MRTAWSSEIYQVVVPTRWMREDMRRETRGREGSGCFWELASDSVVL